jgi:hypothetical protein
VFFLLRLHLAALLYRSFCAAFAGALAVLLLQLSRWGALGEPQPRSKGGSGALPALASGSTRCTRSSACRDQDAPTPRQEDAPALQQAQVE